MEQHPVPQNISTFQFRLIGDITLKQFGYLCGGFILGYVALKIPLVPALLRWPFAAFWVLLGFGLAFVPIEERPLDRWLLAFIKSVYSPTQYVWKKNNHPPELLLSPTATVPVPIAAPPMSPVVAPKPVSAAQVAPQTKSAAPVIPKPVAPVVKPPPVIKPPPPLPPKKSVGDWWTIGAPPVKNIKPEGPIQATVSASITGKKIVFEEKKAEPAKTIHPGAQQTAKIQSDFEQITQKLNTQIASLQTELAQGSIAKERLTELQEVLTQLVTEKERLSKELLKVRSQLEQRTSSAIVKPTEYASVPVESKTTVKMVPAAAAAQIGLPALTTQPNVITGIIKDSQGNLLPNLIVTVKDKESIPVRALKSNKLGQFAASTPLTGGTYVIEVEDPKKQFQFNRIEVGLSGAVLPPLEISAISQRDVVRQQLTKELFGRNNI